MFQPNATLTFKIAKTGGTVRRDPVTGNPILVTETIVVKASLEAVENASQTTLPGVDVSAFYLEGRLIKPKFLTPEMKVHKTVDMTLQRGRNTELKGKFYILPFSRSRLGLEAIFGDFLAGYFQVGDT